MNTAIIRGAQAISFAVAIDIAAWVIPQLIQHGRVRRGYLGVVGRPSRSIAASCSHSGWRRPRRARSSLEPQSPAARAGLREGDLIVGIDGVDDRLGGPRCTRRWTRAASARLRAEGAARQRRRPADLPERASRRSGRLRSYPGGRSPCHGSDMPGQGENRPRRRMMAASKNRRSQRCMSEPPAPTPLAASCFRRRCRRRQRRTAQRWNR